MLNIYTTSTEENLTRYLISSGLAITMKSLGYSVGFYKPIQMNCEYENDSVFSKELNFLNSSDKSVYISNSYYFGKFPNPLIAAAKSGNLVQKEKLISDFREMQNFECSIIDGLDGFGTPINVDFTEEDMIKTFNIPLLFVISPQKTTLNSTIMNINHAKSSNINVRGVILNDYIDNNNENVKFMPRFIEEYTDAKVLGAVCPMHELIQPQELIDNILNSIDLEAVFNVKIEKLEI